MRLFNLSPIRQSGAPKTLREKKLTYELWATEVVQGGARWMKKEKEWVKTGDGKACDINVYGVMETDWAVEMTKQS